MSSPNDPYKIGTGHIPPSEILEGLYIGNFYDANNPKWLVENKIDAVLNVGGVPLQNLAVGVGYYIYPLDQPFKHTKDFAVQAVKRLAQLREDPRRVLVHCWAGVDRSPTVVQKYLTDYLSMDDTVEFIKEKRVVANPHPDWWD